MFASENQRKGKLLYYNNFKKALSIDNSSFDYILNLAFSEVILRNNLSLAFKLLKNFKKIDINKLNLAFIECNLGRFDKAITLYQEVNFEKISVDQINQIEEFSIWYLDRYNQGQTHLILFLINYYGRQNYPLAKKDFKNFFNYISNSPSQKNEKLIENLKKMIIEI